MHCEMIRTFLPQSLLAPCVALSLISILTCCSSPDVMGISMTKKEDTAAGARWGVMKVIDWKIHYLKFDPALNSRSWHEEEEECSKIVDRGSALRLAKAAGGLVVELATGQFELPAPE